MSRAHVDPLPVLPDSELAPAWPDLAALEPASMRAERARMVEDLVRLGDLRSPRVVDAMRRVPRHVFVPQDLRDQAYANRALSIGERQTISQPTVVALMTEALELSGKERVLEIGTGSGYQAAVLSLLAKQVYSVECVPVLGRRARIQLERLRCDNVILRIGDGYEGWPEHAPFDGIILTAAPPEIPRGLLEQLAEGGVIVAPVGHVWGPGQTLVSGRKTNGEVHLRSLGRVEFVPMVRGEGPVPI